MSAERVTFELNKLVPDGVLAAIIADGQEPKYRELSPDERLPARIDKVIEEAHELQAATTPEDVCKELKGVYAALVAVAEAAGIAEDELPALLEEFRKEKGWFTSNVFLQTVALERTNPWAAYYASLPDRFPEIPQSDSDE